MHCYILLLQYLRNFYTYSSLVKVAYSANFDGKYWTTTELKGHKLNTFCRENCRFSPGALVREIPARTEFAPENTVCARHLNDVMTWEYFPHCWPFSRGIHRSVVNHLHKGQVMRSVVSLKKRLEKTFEFPVIWVIMTLMWRHCNWECICHTFQENIT